MPENPTPPPPPQPASPQSPTESQARMWNMLCHLSALAIFIPFGNLIGPLLVWQIKKNEFPSVEAHGKASLNFQITVTLAAMVAVVLGFALACIYVGVIFFFIAPALGVCGLVFAIIAGLKANEGVEYRYPYSLNLIK